MSSPVRAAQESQLSAVTSPATASSPATMSPSGTSASGGKRAHYLYGRPLTIQLGASNQLAASTASNGHRGPTTSGSSGCNGATIKTNLPLPIHSDEITTTAGEDAESEDSNFPPPPPLLQGH